MAHKNVDTLSLQRTSYVYYISCFVILPWKTSNMVKDVIKKVKTKLLQIGASELNGKISLQCWLKELFQLFLRLPTYRLLNLGKIVLL